MPQVEVQRSVSRLKLALILVGCVVVVAAIFGGLSYWQWLGKADQRYQDTRSQANKYIRINSIDQAVKVYTDYLKTNPSKKYTYQTEIFIAEAYQQKGDAAKALEWFQRAEKLDSSLDLVVKPGIGMAAQQLGNKELSIREFKESIELVKKSDSALKNQTIHEYEASITSQGGQL